MKVHVVQSYVLDLHLDQRKKKIIIIKKKSRNATAICDCMLLDSVSTKVGGDNRTLLKQLRYVYN